MTGGISRPTFMTRIPWLWRSHQGESREKARNDILRAAARIKPDSLDRYEIIPEAASRRDLGKWLVEHDRLTVKVPEALRPSMDQRSIGTDYLNSHEGEFLSFGYVGIRTEAMEQMREKRRNTAPSALLASPPRRAQARAFRWEVRCNGGLSEPQPPALLPASVSP